MGFGWHGLNWDGIGWDGYEEVKAGYACGFGKM